MTLGPCSLGRASSASGPEDTPFGVPTHPTAPPLRCLSGTSELEDAHQLPEPRPVTSRAGWRGQLNEFQ